MILCFVFSAFITGHRTDLIRLYLPNARRVLLIFHKWAKSQSGTFSDQKGHNY